MGIFGLFNKKKKETLDQGLEKTKQNVFTKLTRAIAGKSEVDDDVLDNLERGTQQFEEGDPHRQGMEMICKQFQEVLTKLNVAEIPAFGEKFNPEVHNAVMHTEDENAEENTIVEVFQKGYTLGDKVLRFAMVKVAN